MEPAATVPVAVEPVATEPVNKAQSAMTPITPSMTETPEFVAEVAMATPPVPPYSAPSPVNETISAASDLAAASAKAVSTTITATADTVAAVTAEAVETASSIQPTKTTLTQGITRMMKSTEDFVAFGQANLEAFVKSGQIWSAGVQELTKQIATSAKASFDDSVSTFKAMSTAKSVKEAMDLQSNFAKAALEKAMAESNKLTDASIKLTEQTLAPITARVTVAVETFGKAA
jgi:phasin family protein